MKIDRRAQRIPAIYFEYLIKKDQNTLRKCLVGESKHERFKLGSPVSLNLNTTGIACLFPITPLAARTMHMTIADAYGP